MANPINLNITVAGTTPGGTYVGSFYGPLIDANWQLLTDHDHTTGKGSPITSAALNINADVSWNSHAITNMSALGVTAITSDVSFTTHNLTSIGNATGNHFFSNYQYDVYKYGAVGDGTTNDRTAFFNACAAITGSTAGAGVLRLDAGKFRIGTNLTIPKGVTLEFNGGTLLIDNGVQVLCNEPIRAPQNQQIFFYTPGYSVTPFQYNQPSGANDTVYMTWFGLLSGLHLSGSGNAAAWKAAVDSLASPVPNVDPYVVSGGGRIVVPNGDYNFTSGLFMQGSQYNGIEVVGASFSPQANTGVNFYFNQTDGSYSCFFGGTIAGGVLSNCVFRNLAMQQGPQAGPFCIGVDNTVPVGGQPYSGIGYGFSSGLFDQCSWNCLNPDVVGMKKRVQNTEFRNCRWVGAVARTAPCIYMDGGEDVFHGTSTQMGQSEKVTYTGISQFDQGFNVSTPETAYFFEIEAWGTGLGVGNFNFEVVRFEQVHSGSLLISGAQFVTFQNLCFEDPGATALLQPDLLCTYSNNDGGNHFANNIIILAGFGQPTDSDSIPQIKAVGNPGGGSNGPIIIGSTFGHAKATNCRIISISSDMTKASGSTDFLQIGTNGASITGVSGLSSGPTFVQNLCGNVTVTSGTSQAVLLFGALAEANGGYKLVVGSPQGIATTIIAPSGGQTFPQSTVHVADTTGWPSAGNAALQTTGGIFEFAYTGKTSTTLTGVTGGAGTMTNGAKIQNVPAVSAQLRVANVSTFPAGFIIDLETTAAQDLTFNWHLLRND